jgi:hypothetical protein
MKKFYSPQKIMDMKKLVFLLISICCFYFNCQKKSANFVTHNFSKQQWIGGLTNIFSGLKLHLNNFTSIKHQYEQADEFAYENPSSSSLSVPSVSSVPLTFDSPVTRQDPYSIYLNDVNSSGFATDAYNGDAYVTISFESDGTEIIGDCVNNIACICGSPRLDLSNITTVIPLTFWPKDGGVNIEAGDVSFHATIAESGPCVNNACAFLCDIFAPNRKSDMQTAIEQYMEDYVDGNSGLISPLFTQYLKTLGVSGPIISIQIQSNGDLKVVDKE